MKKNKTPSLIKTNPYLQDPAECDAGLTRSVISSSAIEVSDLLPVAHSVLPCKPNKLRLAASLQRPLDHAGKYLLHRSVIIIHPRLHCPEVLLLFRPFR